MQDDIVVSYSELDTYRQCPLKHHWSYVERWTKPTKPGSALDKGSLWHQVLEQHYKVLKATQGTPGKTATLAPQDRISRAWKKIRPLLFPEDGSEPSEVQDLVHWMYKGHIEAYGLDDDWFILGVEHRRTIRLLDLDNAPSPYALKIRADLIIRDRRTGKIWIIDHKSCAELPKDYELDLDDQFGLYTWAYRASGLDILGSIHDAARTKRLVRDMRIDERFHRTAMNRTDDELEAIARDAYLVARAAYPGGQPDPNPYSSPDIRQCGWKCDFREVHLHTRKGYLGSTLEDAGFHQDFTRH